MNKFIHLFSHSAPHTTARYFFDAIQNSGYPVKYWTTSPDLCLIDDDDVFFFIDPAPDWPIGLEKLQCLTVAYLIDVHQDLNLRIAQSNFFDKIYIAQKDYIEYFDNNIQSQLTWLPLACAPNIYSNTTLQREIDISFIGNFGAIGSFRNSTLTMLKNYFPNFITDKFILPDEMVGIYQKSKIVFNISVNGDLNMRFFEALASGALLITDRINNGLNGLFKENIHYVGYASAEEAFEKIKFYLQHEKERLLIAKSGFDLARSMHTYEERWGEISSDIDLNQYKNAPARRLNQKDLSLLYSEIFLGLRKPIRATRSLFLYGINTNAIKNLLYTCCRKLNQIIPITPRAIAFKIKNSKRY